MVEAKSSFKQNDPSLPGAGGLESYGDPQAEFLGGELARLHAIAPNAFKIVANTMANGGIHSVPEDDMDAIHPANDWVSALASVAINHYRIESFHVYYYDGSPGRLEHFKRTSERVCLSGARAIGVAYLGEETDSASAVKASLLGHTSDRHKIAVLPFWTPHECAVTAD